MKRLLAVAVVAVLLSTTVQARVWTDATGKNKVEAEYVGQKDGKVILRKPDGNLATVPLDRLSAADQKHVEGLPASILPKPRIEEPAAEAPAEKDRFTKAVEENANDPGAYYTRGMARLNQGKFSEAQADFNKALQLQPDFAAAYDGRGVAKSKMGEPLAAHADFDKAIELDPELASAYRHRGDNTKGLWETPQGKQLLKDRADMYRER